MKPQNPKTLAVLAGVALAAALPVLFRPAARAQAQPSVWEPAEATGWADPGEADRSEELDARHREMVDRCRDKRAVVDEVIRGDRTLGDAAERLRELNAGHPCPYGDLPKDYPNAGEDELACRQLIRHVRRLAQDDPARYAAAVARLEAELAGRFPHASGG